MPEYSPTIDAGFVKPNQFFNAGTISLQAFSENGITIADLSANYQNFKTSDKNAVFPLSITDSTGQICATGWLLGNGDFIPGPGFISANCPVHGTAGTGGGGPLPPGGGPTSPNNIYNIVPAKPDGGGSGGTGSANCTCGFFPYLGYPTDYNITIGTPDETCNDDTCPKCDESDAPVRYFDGKIQHTVSEITGGGFLPWGHSRSYDNAASFDVEQHCGFRWRLNSIPHLNFYNKSSEPGSTEFVKVVIPNGRTARFKQQGNVFIAENNGSETLTHRPALAAYEVRWADGTTALFNDFSDYTAARGCLRTMSAPDGQSVSFIYNADKTLCKMERTFTENGLSIREELLYSYVHCSDNYTRISALVLRRSEDGGTTWNEIKRIEYTYYAGNEFHGSEGDLKFAVSKIKDGGNWVEEGTHYYRYYKEGEAKGFAHGLKYILEPDDFARFLEMQVIDALDSQLAPYASNYFEYDNQRRVVLEQIDGGQPASVFAYSEGVYSDNPNHWVSKTTETLPDNSVKIIYSSADGKTLLTDERPSLGAVGLQIVNHYVYDSDGNRIRHNTPESIESYQDYVWYEYCSELSVNIKPNEGLVHKSVYYGSNSGQPKGKLFREIVQRGQYGTEIITAEYEYLERALSASAGTVIQKAAFTAKITRFAGEGRTLPSETRFEYVFAPETLRVLEKRTIKPAVAPEQNGTGTEDVLTERFDKNGRIVWSRDESGVITYHQYDALGRLIKTIQDADLTRADDFTQGNCCCAVPCGWSSSPEAKHLVSDFKYDSQGRLVEMLSPVVPVIDENGLLIKVRRASWTVYDDINRTVRSASGSITIGEDGTAVAETLTNPVSITIRNRSGQVAEKITAQRSSTDGRLLAADAFQRSQWLTWEKNIFNFGDVIAQRQYTDIPVSGEGTAG
ncbi:MAG: hypothetical protein FWE67_12275, partial [Planctomycetaceae bacterium]|nr:hypothetical protein [Planctomycetaceae bacterium]